MSKSQCILTELCAQDSEYIFERTTEFRQKVFVYSGVINLEISTTKYVSFYHISQCSHWSGSDVCWQDNAPAHMACETMQLLTRGTSDFITRTLWPANSLDFSPGPGGDCRSVCTAAEFMTSPSWSRAWSKSGNISTRWSLDHRWSSPVTLFDFCTSQSHI